MTRYWIYLISILPFGLSAQDCAFNGQKAISVPATFTENKGGAELFIAVAVHIIELEGAENQISDRAVFDQIAVLNRDFNALNHEWRSLPAAMKAVVGSANVHFFLPTVSPSGMPSKGIIRTTTMREDLWSTGDIYSTDDGGQDPWPGDQYLNVWVTNLTEGLLGFSTSPEDIGERSDGVIISSRAFGIRPENKKSGFGRSLVHEIGHYLGLLHPWGIMAGECEEDDGIADTPSQEEAHRGCPPQENKGCADSEPIYWNYMDYTSDCCMALFTEGQVETMRYVLENQRSSLVDFGAQINEQSYEPAFTAEVVIYPNPATTYFSVDWSILPLEQGTFFQSLRIYDMSGKELIRMPLSSGRKRIELCTDILPKGVFLLLLQNNNGEMHNAGKLSVL